MDFLGQESLHRGHNRLTDDRKYRLVAMQIEEDKVTERWEVFDASKAKNVCDNWRRIGVDGHEESRSITIDEDIVHGEQAARDLEDRVNLLAEDLGVTVHEDTLAGGLLKMRWVRSDLMQSVDFTHFRVKDTATKDDEGNSAVGSGSQSSRHNKMRGAGSGAAAGQEH
jgi:hypothetical protein